MSTPNITTIDATTTVTTTVVVPPPAPLPPKDTPEEKEQRILTHRLLARQLEYYFSTENLSKDTYLSTLRDLNDSYVPVSIIANFGKVQALAPLESALEAVVEAATNHSDLLEIVELDEEGKKINKNQEEKKDESEQATVTILAVGSITQNPISSVQTPKTEKSKQTKLSSYAPPTSVPQQSASGAYSKSNVQNTIILREVAEDVDEQTLKDLFGFEGCPPIESIRSDLQNCWFVTLDTSSKDDMFNVMMQLRTAKFPSGDSVKARLKSSATASPLTPNAVVYNPKISAMYAPQFNANTGGHTNSRKKRSNKGRNNNNLGVGGNNKPKYNQQGGANTSKRRTNSKDTINKPPVSIEGGKIRPKNVTQKPPSMGESNFPSLPPTSDGISKPFRVEKVPEDDEIRRSCEKERHAASGFSDSSSTATSSTASTPTANPPSDVVGGGYAAALLRPAAPAPIAKKVSASEKPKQQQPRSSIKKAKVITKKVTKNAAEKTVENSLTESKELPSVALQPPVWGKGRSFADIVSA